MDIQYPGNEFKRISTLSDFLIDPSDLQVSLNDLTTLAAKIAGTEISLINLIDSVNQWSIAQHGLDVDQVSREDSVCQYTILGDTPFEVKRLDQDDRFRNKFYVTGYPHLIYYMGIPLQYNDVNLGALCMLDREIKDLSPEKIEMLQMIANEIVDRLESHKNMMDLLDKLHKNELKIHKIMHDIRGPLAGITGLAEIMIEEGKNLKEEELQENLGLIVNSGQAVIGLAEGILSEVESEITKAETNLNSLCGKLKRLFGPQALVKGIKLDVRVEGPLISLPKISEGKLLQIMGNLISNAIKFTPGEGEITSVFQVLQDKKLMIKVEDTGLGMEKEKIKELLSENHSSSTGTSGETGFGFGLRLVKQLVCSLNGSFDIQSELSKGSTFTISLPFA